jgi:hypothetical protein
VPDDAPIDDDPDLLNFTMTGPELVVERAYCRKSTSLIQGNRMVRFGKLDGPVFAPPDVGLAISVFSHEDIERGFWMRSRLTSLILHPSTNF